MEELAQGALLGGGRYRIDVKLDAGGMGAVYRALDQKTNSLVAIKLVHEELARDPTIRERFRREAMAAAALANPFIAAALDFGMDERGRTFMVMEYVDGRKLSEVLRVEAPLAESRVVFIAAQILDALAATHAAGIVHRDLKPPNVVLTTAGGLPDLVKLMDFGIAKLQESEAYHRLTATGQIVGTPAFMAPEQARGERVDGRADLYALGVVMYGALSNRLPYDVGDHAQLLVAIQDWAPTPLCDVATQVSPGLWRDVIAVALAKRPEDRFTDARAMRAALDPHLGPARAWLERARTVIPHVRPPPELRASVPGPPPAAAVDARRGAPRAKRSSGRSPLFWAFVAALALTGVIGAAGLAFIVLELALGHSTSATDGVVLPPPSPVASAATPQVARDAGMPDGSVAAFYP